MTNLRVLLMVAAAFALTGCGLTKGKETAAKAADAFHQQFNDSKFADIYSGADAKFKASMKEADFLKFIQAVRRKLGAYQTGSVEGWSSSSSLGTTLVELSYKSNFEQGPATEVFTYVISGDTTTLQGYHINSMTLIVN